MASALGYLAIRDRFAVESDSTKPLIISLFGVFQTKMRLLANTNVKIHNGSKQ